MEKIDSSLKRILPYLKPYKKKFLLVGLALLISTDDMGFLQLLGIWVITDDGMLQQDMAVIVRSALVLAGLVLVSRAIDFWQTCIFADIHNKSYYAVFHQVFGNLLHLEKSYFEDKNNTEILSFLQMAVSQVFSVTDRYIVMKEWTRFVVW